MKRLLGIIILLALFVWYFLFIAGTHGLMVAAITFLAAFAVVALIMGAVPLIVDE